MFPPSFPPEWHLIHQESSLVSSCIYQGLTDLRKANIDNRGLFYTAFYNLAIGLERLIKLTLIIDHMQSNNLSCPTSDDIRRLGHDLVGLLKECQRRASSINIFCDLAFSSSAMKLEIIHLLNDYSKGLRYYNLDTLTGRSNSRDPLSIWNSIVMKIYNDEVPANKRNKTALQAQFFADTLRDTSLVIYHDLEQNSLDVDGVVMLPMMIEAAAPYAVCHIIEIVQEINKVQFAVADLAHEECAKQGLETSVVPFVHEHYFMLGADRKRNLKRKRWPR
jgi:hypothetical protein